MFSELKNLFAPNKTLSKSATLTLVGAQIATLFLCWVFSPFIFLPSQGETFSALAQLWNEGLATDLITSFALNLQAIGVATAVSLLLAYATVMPFFRPIVIALTKLRFLSLVGLTFFFTLAAKSGHELKLYLLVFSISVYFITSMADVLASIPKVQFDLARTLRMSPWRVVWEVVVLGQADKVFDVMKQNAAVGWAYVSMVEGMAREGGGVGTLLLNNSKHFHLASILAIQLLILAVGLGQDYAIGVLRNMFCPYSDIGVERK